MKLWKHSGFYHPLTQMFYRYKNGRYEYKSTPYIPLLCKAKWVKSGMKTGFIKCREK